MLQSTTPVLLRTTKYYSSTTPYYKVQSTTPVLLRTTKYSSTTPYYKLTTKYYSSTTPYYKVLLCTTKYYSRPKTYSIQYYSVLLLKYYSVLQSTTPVLLQYYSGTTNVRTTLPSNTHSVLQSTTPVLLRTTKYYSDRNDVRTTSIQYYSVLQSTTPVLLRTTKYYSVQFTKYYSVLLCTTKYYSSTTKRTTKYYSRTVLRTTKYYSSTTPYYKVLLQYYYYTRTTKYYSSTTPYYKVLQLLYNTSPTLDNTPSKRARLRHQYYSVLQSNTVKLPKRAFRARLPQLFKPQLASKTSISCEASSTFQEQASKTSISCEASATFQRTSFQNEHFVRGFRNFSRKKLPERAFCDASSTKASKTSIFFRNFSKEKRQNELPQLFKQGASKVLRLPRKTRK